MPKRLIPTLVVLALASLACNAILRPFQTGTIPSGITPAETVPFPDTPTPAPTAIYEAQIDSAVVVYYDIYGSSEEDLLAGMQANSLVDDSGYAGFALTSWYVSWNWPGYGTENCDLSKAYTGLDITITMPRWRAPADANPQLVEKWNRFISALAFHEQQHVENVYTYYPLVLPAIQNATCLSADQAAQDVLNQLRQADFAYDQETGHGLTEGATFP